ncbi:hypothetical protein C8Q73DRAFT_744583 [Cubamyces lactineus]|nr:hypothetical protein C8Q73DRAFT_744583 [Cubamyces lactineus]
MTESWNPAIPPVELPPHILSFLSCRIGVAKECIRQLWLAVGFHIWTCGLSMLEEVEERRWIETYSCDHMLYPETYVCTIPSCPGHGTLLRLWDAPTRVQVFTAANGVYDAYAVQLSCGRCKAVYHPNYIVRSGKRQYYGGIPDFVQVSGHKYVDQAVLEHFTSLSVLSWTSATNAAYIYKQSMAKLLPADAADPRFRLRTSHTWDGFVILALIQDAERHGGVLEVPNDCLQKDRFTEAMRWRSERIERSGQLEFAHWCTRCVRCYNDEDGITRYVDYVIMDGIDIGRPCCGVHGCSGDLRTPQDHWCAIHKNQASFCTVEGCSLPHRQGHPQVAHPMDAVMPDAPVDEEIELDLCPEKPAEGNHRLHAQFGQRRTHNEQLIVHPCGIITCRETFYGSESLSQVRKMLNNRYSVPGSMLCFIHYNNNCGLFKHCRATPGEDLHESIGLPVDVFHWKSKHKKTEVECSFHCNPYCFPELLNDDGTWSFNSSRAEQTNVWFGGYHAICRTPNTSTCYPLYFGTGSWQATTPFLTAIF